MTPENVHYTCREGIYSTTEYAREGPLHSLKGNQSYKAEELYYLCYSYREKLITRGTDKLQHQRQIKTILQYNYTPNKCTVDQHKYMRIICHSNEIHQTMR